MTETKSKIEKKTKFCTKCGIEKDLSAFYVNKEYEQQEGRDAWCKDCVASCRNKSQIKEYFFENNRKWDDRIWTSAQKKAERLANANATYTRMNDERKAIMLEKITCQQVPNSMTVYYSYIDNSNNEFVDDEEEDELVSETRRDWNNEWYGSFTKREIERLNLEYGKLASGKEIDHTTEDYLRKICKQSLTCDKLMDDFAAGKCDYSVVKDALSVLDNLNKSANLAACKRKDEAAETISICEISKYLEENGYLQTRKIEWEKDDVDLTISEFGYTVTDAIGEET